MPTIAILGSGAVGALLGAALARGGADPVLVTREETAALLARAGLRVDSPLLGDHHVRVRVAARLDDEADALVVAVKAPHLPAALQRIRAEPGVVVPLLNGTEHMAALRARFGDRVVAGVVRVQAHRDGPAHVVHRSPMLSVAVAAPGAPALTDALRAAGVEVATGAPEADVLWGKLTRLAGLALATTAADAPLGDVRADAEAVAREVAAIAAAEGAAVGAEAVVAELRALPDAASSSLRADVGAGRADHELDAIGGAVLRAGARHGLPMPRTAALVAQVETRAVAR
ncbi:2-dehydropantoate 2-reductase [Baekduia soli]|uniref:2-dehydropantoate 2-reductase n=1 Tax=Baekduia soli TaxID=496014 RepID=A0A5B8U288_9ACTN|nr:2-dehydropantoate 2-reductase [Baekduia soli]QEC47127.1 2-dehydropantoate 2-reductase [Baekduia soli]